MINTDKSLIRRDFRAIEQSMSPLHNSILVRLVVLLLGRDLEDDGVDFGPLINDGLDILLAGILGDQNDCDVRVLQELAEDCLDLLLG